MRGASPHGYRDALLLNTEQQAMFVAVLPGSRGFHLSRPYSAYDIEERVRRWAAERGYGTLEAFAGTIDRRPRGLDGAQASIFRAAMKALCGISTLPNWRMRFLPSFCLSRSLRLREMSPP